MKMGTPMKALTTAEKRKNTADAAEALVAEVLMQRFGYVVLNKNVEYPNHQVYDLLVTKPGIEFFVQVKGLEKKARGQ